MLMLKVMFHGYGLRQMFKVVLDVKVKFKG